MNPKTQTADGAPEAASEKLTTDATVLTKLMHRNVERLASLQKATLDTLSTQTADVTETVRKSFKGSPAAPAVALCDLAEKGMDGWINAQKNLLDLIVEQSAHTTEVTDVRGGYATQSIAKLGELVQQTIERTTNAQKAMLDFAAKQNEIVVKSFQQGNQQLTAPLTELAQSMQRGVSTFIDKQKEFLDTANKMAKEATASKA